MSYYGSYQAEHEAQIEYERQKRQYLTRKDAQIRAANAKKKEEERQSEMKALHDSLNNAPGFWQQFNK